jgi:hypothetical protein
MEIDDFSPTSLTNLLSVLASLEDASAVLQRYFKNQMTHQ